MTGYEIGEMACTAAVVVGTCGGVVFGAVLAPRVRAAERRRRARAADYRARRRAARVPCGLYDGTWSGP